MFRGHAGTFADFHQGLGFLIEWPAPEVAVRMILARHSELDGDHYGCLTGAAEVLEAKYPLAATLALRAMIDFALDKARAKRYPHAARHLQTCADLAKRIGDTTGIPITIPTLRRSRRSMAARAVSGTRDDPYAGRLMPSRRISR